MDLFELENQVKDEESFLRFIEALKRDRENAVRDEKKSPSSPFGPDAGGWGNTSIEGYLEAASAWAEDSSFGRSMAFPEYELHDVTVWRRIAAFLMAGRVYE